ncbi:hypothetical protein [Candidatus Amarolinea aalborgensis]|uniref:hypothetical protein n=1 Tax=Candidatus Amarolinea aalborgensis TaxID=2249329 RepID=UPI003BF94465
MSDLTADAGLSTDLPAAPATDAEDMSILAAEPEAAVMAVAASLRSLADAQRAILNGQQANRDLIGVVVQDNFNLKAENQRLRDRMLSLERDLTELRRRDEARREGAEARLQAAEAAVNTLLEQVQRLQAQVRTLTAARAAPVERSKGLWARLLGD